MDANERKAYKLYKKGGQHLVYDYVTKGLLKHDKWGYCEPCEIDSPIYDESCLVCGSIYKESGVMNETTYVECVECGDRFNKFQGILEEGTCMTCILKREDPDVIRPTMLTKERKQKIEII